MATYTYVSVRPRIGLSVDIHKPIGGLDLFLVWSFISDAGLVNHKIYTAMNEKRETGQTGLLLIWNISPSILLNEAPKLWAYKYIYINEMCSWKILFGT